MASEAETLSAARGGDRAAFDQLLAPYRRELLAHCYRMLGSPRDAEDALQEALLGAWKGLSSFEGRSSLRSWLYSISTHACLRLGSKRPRRIRSWDHGPARTSTADLGEPILSPIWLEPWRDPEPDAGAGARQESARESIELALVAALQWLPGTQRAAVILCDALDFSGAEAAAALGTSLAALNSTLQRGRQALAQRREVRSQQVELAALGAARQRELVDAFVRAWEQADVPAITALLAEDARFTMPPLPAWFDGRTSVVRFFAERVFATPWRLVPLELNAQLGFACYMQPGAGADFQLGALNVLSLRDQQVSRISGFVDPGLGAALGVPARLEKKSSADR